MSNNYNTTLQSNNTDLQAILDTINELPEAGGGEPVLQDKTVSPTTNKQTITADSGYDGLDTVTVNAMPTAAQATPSITINTSGLITATATQTAGYVSAGTKSGTKQLAFQPAKTITPSTTNQIAVSSGYYTGGAVTVKGDSNLTAGNIKSGVSIFGISGTYTGGGGSGSNETEDGLISRTITTIYNDRVTSIGSYAFYYCTSLKTVSFPACTAIGSYAFMNCSKLSSAFFSTCKTIYERAFNNCYSLATINFPTCQTISSYAFHACSKLTSISLPACTRINDNAFWYCQKLTSIYLTGSSVCTLGGSTAFAVTRIATSGTIYVPASLLASYKAATNWTYFSSRFVGI